MISLLIIPSLMIIFYIYIILKNSYKYSQLFSSIEDKSKIELSFVLPFFIFLSDFSLDTSKFTNSEIRKTIQYFQGNKYFRFHELYYISKKACLIFFISIILMAVIYFSNNILLSIVVPISILGLNFAMDKTMANKYIKVKDDIKKDLPILLTRLSLMIESGINFRTSLNTIISQGQGQLVEELKNIQELIENGHDEAEAYKRLTFFSEDMILKKFVSIIIQNIEKGSENFSRSILELKDEAWKYRRAKAIEMSKRASQKLLIPNLFIFISILLMVMVPMLLNII